jgi:hypothetical protein
VAKVPYGFEVDSDLERASPWSRLEKVRELLEGQKSLPPFLANWLGTAIERSRHDPDELLRQLGLKRRRGRQTETSNEDGWLIWGKQICDLEGEGKKPEEALNEVFARHADVSPNSVERSTMQRWRDRYRTAWNAHKSACD